MTGYFINLQILECNHQQQHKTPMYFDNNNKLTQHLHNNKRHGRTYGFRQIQQLICGQVDVG